MKNTDYNPSIIRVDNDYYIATSTFDYLYVTLDEELGR